MWVPSSSHPTSISTMRCKLDTLRRVRRRQMIGTSTSYVASIPSTKATYLVFNRPRILTRTVAKNLFLFSLGFGATEPRLTKVLQRKSNFGLIERSYEIASGQKERPWKKFEQFVRSKREQAGDGETFKVLFLGRHGQGWHNVAESKYGTHAWDVCIPRHTHRHMCSILVLTTYSSATGPPWMAQKVSHGPTHTSRP